jgi:hypothetical protein
MNVKKISIFISFVAVILFNFPLDSFASLSDGLISSWHFDETGASDPVDSVGTNTLSNNSVSFGSGLLGGSAIFNGTSSYLKKTFPTSLDFGSSDFSICTWFKFNSIASASLIDSWVTGGDNRSWSLETSGSDLEFNYSTSGTNQGKGFSASWNPSISVWYDVCVVRSSSDLKVYVNNTQLGTTYNIGGDSIYPASNGNLMFGSYDSGTGNFYNGQFDETEMWSKALTTEEMTSLYASGVGLAYPFVAGGGLISSTTATSTSQTQQDQQNLFNAILIFGLSTFFVVWLFRR